MHRETLIEVERMIRSRVADLTSLDSWKDHNPEADELRKMADRIRDMHTPPKPMKLEDYMTVVSIPKWML